MNETAVANNVAVARSEFDLSKGDEKLVFFLDTVANEELLTCTDDCITIFLTVTSKVRSDLLMSLIHLNEMINKEGFSSALIQFPADCRVYRHTGWIEDSEGRLALFKNGLLVEEYKEQEDSLLVSDTIYLQVCLSCLPGDSPSVTVSYNNECADLYQAESTFLNALAKRILATLL